MTVLKTVPARLDALRALMKQKGIDACLVPTADFHGSEYVGDYFKCRKYITGFTGSAGTAVIMQDMAGLWTDGRYFLQAAQQLKGSGVTLYRLGEAGVPSVHEFLKMMLKEGQTLAYDGRTVTAREGKELEDLLGGKQIRLAFEEELIGQIWEDRPAMSCRPAWELDVVYAGQSRSEKLAHIRRSMAEKKADRFLLTSLDDIAWLLNIRGDDIAYNPVVLSYLSITASEALLFIQDSALDEVLRRALERDGVRTAPYETFYDHVRNLSSDGSIMVDPAGINDTLRRLLPEDARLILCANPTKLAKAVKNPVEMDNIRRAHLEDGVAVTRFMYWLKQQVGKETITEISAAEKLEQFRQRGHHYLGQSFDPIIAYAAHGSIIHYSATKETDVPFLPRDMVLCDTGGQYLEGTTDITRTIVLGDVPEKTKEMFTRVLRGCLNLGSARFKEGTCGMNLDYLAREPLWELGLDYRHGTGHGVGFCLNVHEGPNSIRPTAGVDQAALTPLQEGMLTSDEPGFYEDNAYGIRHENLVLTVKDEATDYGQFLKFETVTLVPFDLDAVLPEMMSQKERETLNAYHRRVYEALSPRLPEEERRWLKKATREI